MKSCSYHSSIITVFAALTILAFAALADVQAVTIVCFPLDTNPGWSTQGQWSFGVPLGGGSDCQDPTSGHTGANVYGYNLSGDYTNSMPSYYLTTTAINCSGYENVTLKFWRWLGVESSAYDHAKVEVSNNGSTWILVWDHTGSSFCDGAWVECIYDISSVADEQSTVYIRWTMGPTDGSVTYPGWNIDDVCLLGDALGDLSITPPEDFISSGNEGGPFTPDCQTYTLTNTGPNSLDWTATKTQPWLDVTPGSGTLAGGASTTVDVCINPNANILPLGVYTDTVTFSNLTSGIVHERSVELRVVMPEFKLTASDGASSDNFGISVSISGDRCVIGADSDDDKGSSSGSAYIFEWNGTNWDQQAKLTASDGASSDYLGYSVSISGDRCVVGAYGDDDNGSYSGSAYIFEWNGTNWSQQAKLTASDGASSDYFGYSVSISGNRCVIGARYDDDKGSGSGSAYIFEWNGTNWSQQAKLTASDGASGDYFGYSVSISGGRCVVGADGDDDMGSYSGSAYIFEWNGTNWSQKAKLTASDGADSDYFGYSVSISGNCCVVGARYDDDKGSSSGSAYIFEWNGTNWSQQAKLTALDGASGDYFGNSVSISGDRCVVGADGDDDKGSSSGSAYLFEWNGTSWIQKTKLTASDGAGSDYYGCSVSISDDRCVVGARYDDDKGSSSGSAYVYGRLDALRITAVMPPEDFIISGYETGPFTPSTKTYQLTNTGPNSLDWSAHITETWLDIDYTSGTLGPDEITTVELRLTTEVNLLPPGGYSDTILFTNLSNGANQSRYVTLDVNPGPAEIEVTDSISPVDDLNMPFGDVIIGLSRREHITVTNTDPTFSLVVTDISLGGGYFEDFDDGLAQDWEEDVDADWGVVNQEYRAYQPSPSGTNSMVATYSGEILENFCYEVKIRRAESSGYARYIIFRATADFESYPVSTGSGYGFGIDEESYLIFKLVSGTITTLVSWTDSSYINPPTSWNTLKVMANGSDLQFYINGYLIHSLTDLGLTSGRIGLLGYTGTSYSSVTHFFDDVLVTEPETTSQTISAEQQWYNEHPSTASESEAAPENWKPPEYPGQGEVPLQILPVQSANLSSGGFRLENVSSLPVIVAPSSSIDVNVVFEPTDVEECEAVVVIKSSDIDEPEVEVQLSGRGMTDYLEIIPDANFVFSGHPGGPFVPSNTSYQLTNIGPVSIDWTVDSDIPWLDLYSSGGTLNPGESTSIVVAPNAQADTMEEGYHCGDLNFLDIATTLLQKRTVCLNVYTDPKIWVSPYSFEAEIPQGCNDIQILTIGNTGGSALEFSLSVQQTGFTPLKAEDYSIDSILPGQDFTVLADDANFAPGRLLVRFAPHVDKTWPNITQKKSILKSLNEPAIEREYEIVPGLSLVNLPAGVSVEKALVAFNQTKGILYAQPDYEIRLDSIQQNIPNDEYFDDLWGMHNIGQTGGLVDADIDAPEAWDIWIGNRDIIIALLDSGVDYTHPDLSANMWINEAEFNGTSGVDDDGNGYVDDIHGWDFADNDSDPIDYHYHGTHCAGTIGAVGNNGIGVVGVCWDVEIMPLKIFPNYGETAFISGAISAIEYAVNNGARAMSNSWGGGPYNQPLRDTIEAADAAGLLFVASAGNDGVNNDTSPHYPSSYPCENIIAVLSTDYYDNKSGSSCYGPVSVDLGAPGSSILSCEPGGWYQYLSGTSMAGPHVAGACALIWSACPSLTYLEVKDIILQTVDPTLAGLCVSGGRLNLHQAILEAEDSCGALAGGWIGFVPETGAVGPGQTINVNVVFDANRLPGTYKGNIIISSNDPYVPEIIAQATLTIEPTDYFTELFDPNVPIDPNDPRCNDMTGRTLTFSPDGSSIYYKACINEANDFPVDPNGGTIISLGDDDYVPVQLIDASINLYGTDYDVFYIGSNGYVSFISGDIRHFETLEDHFALPRISALFDDLDPSAGGVISWKQLDDRVVVTFENVPEYSLANSNSFQIEMRFNGKLRITLLDIAAQDGLVGLSQGRGLPLWFTQSDLSDYGMCNFTGDLNGDLNTDLTDFAILASSWYSPYEVLTVETISDLFNSISYNGSDGTQDWSGDWLEIGESDGPGAGDVRVVGSFVSNALRIGHHSQGKGLLREADLSGATFAELTFNWWRVGPYFHNNMKVDVSDDGGSSWTNLLTIPDGYSTWLNSEAFDISAYTAPNTQIRFMANQNGNGYVYFDDVQVEYDLTQVSELWCEECDFNQDNRINLSDLLIFCEHWLE